MATGTEGNDVLTNDQTLTNETIDALGGDDTINVRNPHPGSPNTLTRVTVIGGAGIDTLYLSANYISILSHGSAFLHDGTGFGIADFQYPSSVGWSGIERLVVTANAYFGRAQDGTFTPGGWTTGDTADEIHVLSTRGGARITVSSGGGDDKIYLGDVGSGSTVNAGSGDDLIDLTGARVPVSGYGEDGNDTLLGSAGHDQLDGGPGADMMEGRSGDDFYVVDDGGDSVVETESGGLDDVFTSLAVYTLPSNVEILTATGGAARDFRLNSADNFVFGNLGNDLFRLQDGGNDYDRGDAGNDILYFGG